MTTADDPEKSPAMSGWTPSTRRHRVKPPSINGRNTVLLAIAVGALFLLVGLTAEWRDGSGADSTAVAIIWRIVWITYQILKVTLIVFIVVLIQRHLEKRREQSS